MGLTAAALAFAADLSPNFSVKTFSTVFFTSNGFAHRRFEEPFNAPIVRPRSSHPDSEAVET